MPVGLDQKQHLEMTSAMARAFNAAYGSIFTVPEAMIDERVMTIPGLDGRKMSKSYDNVIPVLAPPDVLRKAVMRIKTDSRRPEEPKNPDKDTIFQLFRAVAAPEQVSAMRLRYERGGLAYGQAKEELFQALDGLFRPARERYTEILADRQGIERILDAGADRVRQQSRALLTRVREAVGAGKSAAAS